MNASRMLVGSVVVVLGSGCGSRELSGPPELRPGKDACVECGMLVMEDRCSTGLLMEVGGRREHVVFDDLGCMIDYMPADGARIVESYVHDHTTREWVRAGEAVYLLADPSRLPTPMGSGYVAFGERARAEAARGEFGGELSDYAGVEAAREAWWIERYGKPRRAR